MNLTEYKEKKQLAQKRMSEILIRQKCFKCFRPLSSCLCKYIKSFDTNSRFIILIHPMEAKKQRVGTGRMTAAFLKNSDLIMGIDFSNNKEVNKILDDTNNCCVVLYPGIESLNLSEASFSTFPFPANKRLVIFVIDGTWPCARKMMLQSERVRNLPRICFTPKERSQFIIKHQPAELCLSTIESVYMLLNELDRVNVEDLSGVTEQMLVAFKALNDYQLECAANPHINSYRKNSSYKKPEERRAAKKWQKRKLFVD